jgi:hypothetical protein
MFDVIKSWTSVSLNEETDRSTIIAFDDCWGKVTSCFVDQYLGRTNHIANARIAAALKLALSQIAKAFSSRRKFPRNTCFPN